MSGFVSQELRERIRAANDIVDVIGGYLRLKRVGANYAALCPFHKEKTPSFMVNPRLQIFHCFGCHKGGDVFTFLMEYENIGFMDALKRLADRAGIVLEFEQSPAAVQARQLREKLLEIHQLVAEYWHEVLTTRPEAASAREYLDGRGISGEAITLFKLGFAPDRSDDLVRWASGRGVPPTLLEDAGLIVRNQSGTGWYDRFRGRVMFPICNEHGRVIAFSGRIITGDQNVAKYINSPETPIFQKSRVFYGLDKSRRAIMDAGFAIVCEGQLDLIRIYMAGLQNVVAPQGTAFTAEHARILKRFADQAVLCFDSDEAGQRAMIRALDALLEAGIAVKVVEIPPPDDPDSFILKHGPEAFRALVRDSREFFDYYLDRLCRMHPTGTERGRVEIVREMGRAAAKTQNSVILESVAQKTALRLGLTTISVLAEFNRCAAELGSAQTQADTEQAGDEPAGFPRPDPLERWLMRIALLGGAGLQLIAAYLDPGWVRHAAVRAALEELLRRLQTGQATDVHALLDAFEQPEIKGMITEIAADQSPVSDPERMAHDVLKRLRDRAIDEQLAEIRRMVDSAETPEQQRLEAMKLYQQLLLQKMRPLLSPK